MKRPIFLTILLILITISNIFSLYSYTVGKSSIVELIPDFPSWAFIFLTTLGILQLVGVAMVWTWKKMGFYLFIVSAIGAMLVNAATLGIGSSLFGIIGIVLLYFAMKPVWGNFK